MRLIRTVLLLSLLATVVTIGGATAAHAKLAVGIADNKSDMFTDSRFTNLKVKYVRVMVPYDAMHDFALRTWLGSWMADRESRRLNSSDTDISDTAPTEISTLSLHDALPIFHHPEGEVRAGDGALRRDARLRVADLAGQLDG